MDSTTLWLALLRQGRSAAWRAVTSRGTVLVARALGPLCERLVFVGGCAAGLLQLTHPRIGTVLITATAAPSGSAKMAKRPMSGMSVGGTSTAWAPSFFACAAVASQSATLT